MKKIVLLVLMTVVAVNIVFANPTTTISGTIELSNGRISVVSGNTIYLIRGLDRYIGVIDGLRVGVQVSLEGQVFDSTIAGQREILFNPVTLTLNGQNYEIASPAASNLAPGRAGRDTPNNDNSARTGRW